MGSKKTKVITTRVKVGAYEWLEGRSGGNVNRYVRKLIESAYDKREGKG